MIEIKEITQPVPYIVSENGEHVVVFIEVGTTISTASFIDFRKAKICATEAKPKVIAAANAGLIDPSMVSDEEWEIEPIVKEVEDEYGFKTVTTEYYKGETVVVIYNKDGEIVTPEHRQSVIDAIEEEKRKAAEREAAKLPAQVDYTATMTSTLLPEEGE